jgi:two-component system CheB/CheR fusion protein
LRAQEKGLRLALNDTLINDDTRYVGDPTRLRQILINLISNAIKFTHKGGVTLTLEKVAHSEEANSDTFTFSVTDTGIGIPESAHAKLFEKFSQADNSTTRKYGGTGLGLAICLQLAEMMGGKMGFRSKEGEGSTFWVTLPLPACCDIEEQRPVAIIVEPKLMAQKNDSPLILVVEDNPVNQAVIEKLLAKLGFAMDLAENGEIALQKLESMRPALIFMDCQMPVMDGFSATRAIRAKEAEGVWPHVPIVALTANAMGEDKAKCLECGMDDYLAKPLRKGDLQEMLEKWLAVAV